MVIHRCDFPYEAKQLTTPGLSDTYIDKRLDTYFKTYAKSKSLPRQKIPTNVCRILNEYYPETVCSDPLEDFKILYEWKTHKRQYAFHTPYPPLGIGSLKGVKASATGPTEAIGSIVAGFAGFALNLEPIVRCVGNFPDFIYQSFSPRKYCFVEAKATTGDRIETQVKKFFRNAIRTLNAKVCHECILVTAEISPGKILEVESDVYVISMSSIGSPTSKDLGRISIFEAIKPHIESELLGNKSHNLGQIILSILNGDEQLSDEILSTHGEEIEQIREMVAETRQTKDEVNSENLFGHEQMPAQDSEQARIDPSLPIAEQITEEIDGEIWLKIRGKYRKLVR